MNDVTQILSRMQQGDTKASERLLPLVYDELRLLARQRLANELPGQTLQATALVHEAYLRLVGDSNQSDWDNRGHFFAAAAEAMRRILVEAARRKKSLRHGGNLRRVDAYLDQLPLAFRTEEVLAVDEALESLREENEKIAKLVELKYFAGFTLEEIAKQWNVSVRTVFRNWAYAKAWLREVIEQENAPT